MCLVEVYTPRMDPATRQPVLGPDGKPVMQLMMNKLQAGCVTAVSDGMEIRTTTDKVQFAQRGQLEFLLTSHPLDCPVCDKGGECPLQNLTMQWGPGNSRYDYSDKVHFEKPIPLGDLIFLDRERCILCARCVRFQDEIADDPVLGFDNRGRAWEIISKSDPPFDSKFSGNTTDICPVGALTSSDFRFKARVWELHSTPHVCTHCPVGCNMSLDMRLGNLMRVMPRENDFVNEIWICDKGRYGMRYFESQERLTTPLIRRGNQLAPASWDEAFQLIAATFGRVRETAGPQALGGVAGPHLPNEDLYLFQKLLRETLGSQNIDHRPGTPADAPIDDTPIWYGAGKGTNLMTLGKGTSVLVIGADVEEEAPLYKLRLRAITGRGGDLTVAGSFPTKLDRSASRVLRLRPGSEAHLVIAMLKVAAEERLLSGEIVGRVRGAAEVLQQLAALKLENLSETTGVPVEQIQTAARVFAQGDNGLIVYGRAALAAGPALTHALANLVLLTGKTGKPNNGLIGLLPGGNSRGALDMGVRPDAGPGSAAVAQPGLGAQAMWDAAVAGKLRAMYIAGLNPAGVSPQLEEALNALEFLVVQDIFLTETAQLADVVLPVAAIPEREGSFTNAERRVQRSRQARQAPAQQPPDWVVFQDIARLFPAPARAPEPAKKAAKAAQGSSGAVVVEAPVASWNYVVSSDIADEIAHRVPGYARTNYISLESTGKSWGREANEPFYYDGTSYVNNEGVGVQLAARADDPKSGFLVSFVTPAPPADDARYPMTLFMPARLYDGGEWAKGSKLQSHVPPAHAVFSLADAQRLGVALGEKVRVESSAGALDLMVQIDSGLPEGLVLVPAVRGVDPTIILTGRHTRVAVSKAD
jgi:NADH-quinone oxidoreductase subunit G